MTRSAPPTNRSAGASGAPAIGFDQLDQVTLDARHRRLLAAAEERSVGPTHWRARKSRETRNALALAQIAPGGRILILDLDMTEHIELDMHMKVTVPCMAPHHHRLVVFTDAHLLIRLPERVMLEELPGTSFVQIRQPRFVWHANVEFTVGALCLGLTLPRNVPLVELIWLSYTALAAQTWMIDERDPVGVLNPDAARWWALNQDKLPLTRTALLEHGPLELNPALAEHRADDPGATT